MAVALESEDPPTADRAGARNRRIEVITGRGSAAAVGRRSRSARLPGEFAVGGIADPWWPFRQGTASAAVCSYYAMATTTAVRRAVGAVADTRAALRARQQMLWRGTHSRGGNGHL